MQNAFRIHYNYGRAHKHSNDISKYLESYLIVETIFQQKLINDKTPRLCYFILLYNYFKLFFLLRVDDIFA